MPASTKAGTVGRPTLAGYLPCAPRLLCIATGTAAAGARGYVAFEHLGQPRELPGIWIGSGLEMCSSQAFLR
jgi:hypothetical protein